MLSERLEEWALAYKAEGELKGEIKGERLALQRLLARRFGPMPTEVTERISNAAQPEIELWLDRVLDAKQLADIFNNC